MCLPHFVSDLFSLSPLASLCVASDEPHLSKVHQAGGRVAYKFFVWLVILTLQCENQNSTI
jgi:hypothetical protein